MQDVIVRKAPMVRHVTSRGIGRVASNRREFQEGSPGVGVEEVVLTDPEDARELLVVARHQAGLGSLLADLKRQGETNNGRSRTK